MRYEIVSGTVVVGDGYTSPRLRDRVVVAVITLVVKPYAIGRQQQIASAYGGLFDDTIGMTDGRLRGLRIPEGTTNKMTNPVFGHATWNNNWSAAASIVELQNTDPAFVLFGYNSAWLQSRAAANNTYTQSINVGNVNTHTLSCYVRRRDGAAVTVSDCQLYYNVSLTTTYTSVGNGWYRLTASQAGINAPTATGILVANGRHIYADGFQIEEKAYATPLAWGDLHGCAWTSTAHASTTTRTAARARLPISVNVFNLSVGSVRVVWKTDYSNTHPNDQFFFSCGAASLRAWFQASDDTIKLSDGVNTITTAALSFTAGSVQILHFAWGPGSLRIYRNGASGASGATYTPPTMPTYIYIGSDDAGATQLCGAIQDFSIFGVQLTTTEMATDNTNATQITADG
ncbi:MAG TPA: LamG-like jellyroll fold domain-containing protein, partial [Anaerolineae bacterium]